MARDPSLLLSTTPTAIAPANPFIAHVQLRDLLVCPREKGVVNYVSQQCIMEQDLHAPGAPPRVLASLNFTPNSLSHLPIGPNDTLLAAGGQETEIHLSYYSPMSQSTRRMTAKWAYETQLTGSINNSVLLTSLSLTGSNESSIEPRVGISNNDSTVRLYDVPMRVQSSRRKLVEVGMIRLDVPINHSSISPDGRTLLSVGDSNKVYFHRITGGARITFTPITTLCVPPPDLVPHLAFQTSSLAASFSTAFSGDGSKFAVASQEGVVAVWDVRSTKVMKVFQTDKMRGLGGGLERSSVGNGNASGWLSDDPWEWTRGTKAPGWCVRSVKFNGGEGAASGKEVMAFTEHTANVHVVDARTFETHEIVRMPTLHRPPPRSRPRQSSAPSVIVSNPPPGSATAGGSGSSVSNAQQRRIQRNMARRLMPVSNARRNTGSSSPSASGSRRPVLENARMVRPPHPHQSESSSSITSASSSTTQTLRPAPAIVQALGDAFRIPASAYSAPASIGDSTWRTLSGVPFGRRTSVPTNESGPSGSSTSGPSSSVQPSSSMDWASYVLDNDGVTHDIPDELREDDGAALARRIRRQERAMRRGMPYGTGLFEDDGESSSSEAGTTDREREERRQALAAATAALVAEHEGIVVVPDLGDREVESEVRAVLSVHGITSRLGGHSRAHSHSGIGASRRNREDDDHEFDMVDLDEGFEDDEMDRDTNTGSVNGDYEYPLYSRRFRRNRMLNLARAATDMDTTFDEMEEDAIRQDEDRMDVDEDFNPDTAADVDGEGDDDAECASNVNSRSVSPSLGPGPGSSGSAATSTTVRPRGHHPSASLSSIRTSLSSMRYGTASRAREYLPKSDDRDLDADLESEAYYSERQGSKMPRLNYHEDLDIGGLCFDPWGESMYVVGVLNTADSGNASLFSGQFGATGGGVERVGSVVEWGVRGADKRFWVDSGWL